MREPLGRKRVLIRRLRCVRSGIIRFVISSRDAGAFTRAHTHEHTVKVNVAVSRLGLHTRLPALKVPPGSEALRRISNGRLTDGRRRS